jgi:hypothetical protein
MKWQLAVIVLAVASVTAGCADFSDPEPDVNISESNAKVVAYYPNESGTYVNETVVTQDSIEKVGDVQEYRAQEGSYYVGLMLDEEAAKNFADTLVENGYERGTSCTFDGYANASGRCLLTIDDGAVLNAAGISRSFGKRLESGNFPEDRLLSLYFDNRTTARRVAADLRVEE